MNDMLNTIDEALLDEANGGLGFQLGAGLSINDRNVIGGSVGAEVGDGGAQVGGSLQIGKKKGSFGISLGLF